MPRDGSATRTRILDSAERLVMERGFAATSVDEVIAESSSSKGAFFHHFPTKNHLGRALVARYAAADIEHLETFMAAAEAETDDPAGQVVAFVGRFEEAADEIVAEQPGCLYVSFIYDRQLSRDGTTDTIVDAIVAWRDLLRAKLQAAAVRHPLRWDVDLEDLANHVFVTFEGAFILARSLGDPSQMRRQLRLLRQFLEALFDVPAPAAPGRRTRGGRAD
jgi:TetR/AcrR family transcriptional repressor of nem operon